MTRFHVLFLVPHSEIFLEFTIKVNLQGFADSIRKRLQTCALCPLISVNGTISLLNYIIIFDSLHYNVSTGNSLFANIKSYLVIR